MSTTQAKRPYAEAVADAECFRAMFDGRYERWEIAGSVRRHAGEASDVEHVVIPKIGEIVNGDGLFAIRELKNLLWHHLDSLVRGYTVSRHVYSNGTNRWGEKYRGVAFRGFCHEIFVADADNWGATLAIRTGPADFSKRLVTGLLKNGLRNKDGRVYRCIPCDWCNGHPGECGKCDNTRLLPTEVISVPTEEEYFKLCGVEWSEPRKRRT